MEPSYSLERIRELFQEGRFRIARSAFETALLMSLLEEDVIDCVTCHLSESHFYKTMPAEKIPGLMQDVYKIPLRGFEDLSEVTNRQGRQSSGYFFQGRRKLGMIRRT